MHFEQQITLKNVSDYLSNIAHSYSGISQYYYGPVWDIETKLDIKYPMMAVVPQKSVVHSNFVELKLRIYMIDRITQEETDRSDAQSRSLQSLLNIRMYIMKDLGFWLLPSKDSDIEPLWEWGDDFCAGWTFDLNLGFDFDPNVCTIPGLTAFNFPVFSAPIPPTEFYALFENLNNINTEDGKLLLFEN